MEKQPLTIAWIWTLSFTILTAGLTVYSCFKSISYTLYDELDRQVVTTHNPVLHLLFVVLILVLLYLFQTKLSPQISIRIIRMLPLIICAFISLFLIFFVRGLAVNDAATMDRITNLFAQGDYSEFTKPGGYLYAKSHQVGYLLYEQIMYRLFGAGNFTACQLMNLLAVLSSLILLNLITLELFEEVHIYRLSCLLSCGLLFLFVYTTHIYNDIISLPFQIAVMYLTIRYLKTHRVHLLLLAACCLTVAYILKTNAIISLIAVCIILIQDGIYDCRTWKRQAFQTLCLTGLLVLLPFGAMSAVRQHYVRLTGAASFPAGEPMISYLTMGLQETEAGQSGWYNGYNASVFRAAGYDHDAAEEMALSDLNERISELLSDPPHMVYFFAKKFLTQWGDASCISMRNLELTSRHVEGHSAIVNSILYGTGRTVCYGVMNIHQTICLVGCSVCGFQLLRSKRITLPQSLILLFIFGGMLFHEFWEGSSRYTMRYCLFFLPFSAYGIDAVFSRIRGRS